ncbi:hypothetical protein APICC_00537 [Apis cerana cerana]|uniref:Uncharacterized protein n=1 Tax=Apis cerana cerana TaxID=94128 RepID=A0A2A3E9X6_APICC|nr:hypothetical protein APICC_00537 [Apis cerana cerana]
MGWLGGWMTLRYKISRYSWSKIHLGVAEIHVVESQHRSITFIHHKAIATVAMVLIAGGFSQEIWISYSIVLEIW